MSSRLASTSRSLVASRSVSLSLPFAQPWRLLSTTRSRWQEGDGNPFNRPAPPPLPPKEQREFEQLVKDKASESAGRLSFFLCCWGIFCLYCLSTDSPQFKPISEGEVMHPQFRAKPKPDFEGDVNPETGEVGGPKKDPLSWKSEWAVAGRVYDF